MTDTETIPAADQKFRLEMKKFVLQSILEKASAVLPSKDIMPVLKNFQVDVQPTGIRVIATDLELSVVSSTEMVAVSDSGTVVFPGKRLLELVREAEDGDLIIDVNESQAHIAVGRTTWDLMLQDGSDYPPLPDTDEIEFSEVDRAKFLGAIQQVRYAAANDTVRPNLMMIDIHEGKMRAADGVRFQQVDLGDALPVNMQIPIGAVDDLMKLLRSTDQTVLAMGESENHLVFRIASDVFIANKLTAMFPNVEQMLLRPALANDQRLAVDRQDLISAVKRVRVTADPETSAVVFDMNAGQVTVSSQDKFGNRSSETLDVFWEAEPRQIALNHEYLMDMLNMADVKSCQFYLGQDTKTRKSALMLKDDEAGMVGILNQIRLDFLQ